jgi:hypothetical protein
LLAHKRAVFDHLVDRWRDLFNASFEVLLYDLTSTYFESEPPCEEDDKRRYGYSRDHRRDCVQVVIALIVTPEGFPLAYEVLPGNTAHNTTLRGFLHKIEQQYGKARRVWVMDRGIPTEAVLHEMRHSDPPVQYLVGTPKGRLSRLERELIARPWQAARPGVEVKLLPQHGELCVFAQSHDRIAKERAMRKRQLKRLWARLKHLAHMGVFYPIDTLPAAVQGAVIVLPLTHAVILIRSLVAGRGLTQPALPIVVLIEYTATSYYIALVLF